MDPINISQTPFAVMTFIAAPALLTNASSLLAMSTINRMLRTRDRMQELYNLSEKGGLSEDETSYLMNQVDRVEIQAGLLLTALHAIYISLGSFSAATLVTLIGAALTSFQDSVWFSGIAGLSLVLGLMGGAGLVAGSANLFWATRLSLVNIHDEAARIRKRQSERRATKPASPPATPTPSSAA